MSKTLTLNDFTNWLEGYIEGCQNNIDNNINIDYILEKLKLVQKSMKHREKAYDYLVIPLMLTVQ